MKKLFEVRLRRGDDIITLHTPARNQEQAVRKVSKGRQVLGVKKLDVSRLFGNIERLTLGTGKGFDLGGGIYEGDIDLDKVFGFNKDKRRSDRERQKKARE